MARAGECSAVFWTTRFRVDTMGVLSMIAVIGNVLVGVVALSLFTATVRLSK